MRQKHYPHIQVDVFEDIHSFAREPRPVDKTKRRYTISDNDKGEFTYK